MIEKKLAIRPARPTTFTKELRAFLPPYAVSTARGIGLAEAWMADEPEAPGPKTRMSAAKTSSAAMPAMRPLGMSVEGSLVSSAASGTPSIARKNQIAYGSAAQMPTNPNGRNELAPTALVGSMLYKLDGSNCGIIPMTKA